MCFFENMVFLPVIGFSTTFAQQNGESYATITGKVIDEDAQEPLPYVEVFIIDPF
jgi:RNase P/RNase MRP subunit p29